MKLYFSDASDNLIVSDAIWPKFKLIHAFMHALATYKNEEDQMKNECARMIKTL